MKDPLSKKWLMALLFSAIGLYLVVIGKLDAAQYMLALAANLGIYTSANIAEGAISKATAAPADIVTTNTNANPENPPSSGSPVGENQD